MIPFSANFTMTSPSRGIRNYCVQNSARHFRNAILRVSIAPVKMFNTMIAKTAEKLFMKALGDGVVRSMLGEIRGIFSHEHLEHAHGEGQSTRVDSGVPDVASRLNTSTFPNSELNVLEFDSDDDFVTLDPSSESQFNEHNQRIHSELRRNFIRSCSIVGASVCAFLAEHNPTTANMLFSANLTHDHGESLERLGIGGSFAYLAVLTGSSIVSSCTTLPIVGLAAAKGYRLMGSFAETICDTSKTQILFAAIGTGVGTLLSSFSLPLAGVVVGGLMANRFCEHNGLALSGDIAMKFIFGGFMAATVIGTMTTAIPVLISALVFADRGYCFASPNESQDNGNAYVPSETIDLNDGGSYLYDEFDDELLNGGVVLNNDVFSDKPGDGEHDWS